MHYQFNILSWDLQPCSNEILAICFRQINSGYMLQNLWSTNLNLVFYLLNKLSKAKLTICKTYINFDCRVLPQPYFLRLKLTLTGKFCFWNWAQPKKDARFWFRLKHESRITVLCLAKIWKNITFQNKNKIINDWDCHLSRLTNRNFLLV